MSIGLWLILGLLVVCCVLPMLMMGKHGSSGSGAGNVKNNSGNPPSG